MSGLKGTIWNRMASGVVGRRILRGGSEINGCEQRGGLRASGGTLAATRSFTRAVAFPWSLHNADLRRKLNRTSSKPRIMPQMNRGHKTESKSKEKHSRSTKPRDRAYETYVTTNEPLTPGHRKVSSAQHAGRVEALPIRARTSSNFASEARRPLTLTFSSQTN